MGMKHIAGAQSSFGLPYIASWYDASNGLRDASSSQIVFQYGMESWCRYIHGVDFQCLSPGASPFATLLVRPPYGYTGATPVKIRPWGFQPSAQFSFYQITPTLSRTINHHIHYGWIAGGTPVLNIGTNVFNPSGSTPEFISSGSIATVDTLLNFPWVDATPTTSLGPAYAVWSDDKVFAMLIEVVFDNLNIDLKNEYILAGVEIRWPV